MIDHITIATTDVEKSKAFYLKAFEPLGYAVSFGEENIFWAFDVGDGALFEIRAAEQDELPITRCHIAFRVSDESRVQQFYRAALDAGANDNGAPGLRPEYTSGYYACFVLDPDGHNIEAMLELG